MSIRKPLVAAFVALAALGATAAHAGNVHWSIGINLPGVVVGPAPVYYAPPPVVYAPPPVVYAPPPVVYYRPAPVVYAPPYRPVVVDDRWGPPHRPHWRDRDRDGRWDGPRGGHRH